MTTARSLAVAGRILRQLSRDRRAVALVVVVPLVVMSLLAVVLRDDGATPKIVLETPGVLDLFARDMADGFDRVTDPGDRLEVVSLPPGTTRDEALRTGAVDAVLSFPATFLEDRVSGKASTVELHVEGSDPMRTGDVASRLAESLAKALEKMPRILPADCQAHCGDTIPAALPAVSEVRLFGGEIDESIDFFTPVLPPFFVFFFVFLLSGLTFLRERVSGTAERLLASPLGRSELVLGYVLGFLPAALVQATITILFARYALGGPWGGAIVVVATLLLALAAESLGVFMSAFAKSEFEVIQFVPMTILPQLLLAGVFWPVSELPSALQPLAYVFPLTYAVRAVRDAAIRGYGLVETWPDLAVLVAFTVLAVSLAALTVRRTIRG